MGGRGASSNLNKRLPNYKNAIISKNKIGNYLLNPSNKNNQGKAQLFNSIGYNMKNKKQLGNDLRSGLRNNKAILQRSNQYGSIYNVYMKLGINKKIEFKTIWEVNKNKTKFVTALPKERK